MATACGVCDVHCAIVMEREDKRNLGLLARHSVFFPFIYIMYKGKKIRTEIKIERIPPLNFSFNESRRS